MKYLVLSALISLPVAASEVGTATDTVVKANAESAQSQLRINQLDEKTRELLNQTREAVAESRQTQLYNRQLSAIIASQSEELASIASQIESIDSTERGVLPLMQDMIDGLVEDISSGVPFLLDERTVRVEQLQALMPRADVSVAEKYRRITEALLIEVEYGRTIEAWRKQESDLAYDYLRVGRIALYRATIDGRSSERWTPAGWESLDTSETSNVITAVKVARQSVTPQLVTLSLPSAGASR